MPGKEQNPKKILYVENGIGYGGAIICLRHLVRNLDQSKFTPLVVTGRTGPDYQGIAKESRWKHIPDRYVEFNNIKAVVEKRDTIKKIPGLTTVINQLLARADDVVNFLPFFIRLLHVVILFKPDLIHANNEPLCNRAAVFAGKLMNIPVICHIRGDQKGSAMMKWLYQLPDHFITVSRWVSESIGKLGVPASKRTVIYDGISFDSIDFHADGQTFRKKFNIQPDDFTVGLIGMLIPWKGQEIFLDAAKILKYKIPNLRMMIIGRAPDEFRQFEEKLKQRVRHENLTDLIIFTGHQTDMDAVYNGVDIAVSASTSPEPLGTMVIETMAMGRPLIAPAHGGGAEMTDHEKTGLLFTPGDAKDLADAILKFHENPRLRTDLGNAAKQKALHAFSVEAHVKNVQAVYDTLLNKTSK
ncbi:MAG: glycosyltransferase family 4 protein [Desulfobacter postgatei]|uniref:glycosyltransferase family 4 protein n=1 Tax=Desulfobacter postgatei TaxID=2293 RepID=UPI0023F11262|nr:glycosyltransferase family 4 protein [Desulfobacter postgatei]MDD4274567.1 glycosyltransferase family 4 protein [Desulfobacter postgatei]